MRRYWIWITLVLGACSAPKSEEETRQSTDEVAAMSSVPELSDSVNYIGFVEKFDDNNTFCTGLYFANGFDEDKFETVKKMGDSVIFQDDDTRRLWIPMAKAGKYFNLTGLKEVNIFNNEGEIVATGKLDHLEYFDDATDGSFVAVYNVDHPDVSHYAYCISTSMKGVTKPMYSVLSDEALTTALAGYLQIKKGQIDVINHYRFNESGVIYSALSADTTAYIVASVKNERTILYKSEFAQAINALNIIGKDVGGRPILLANCSEPDSDFSYASVLTFRETQYEISPDHRVRK